MRKIHISITAVAHCSASRMALALLVSTVSAPVHAAAAEADAAAAAQSPNGSTLNQPIIVTAPPVFRDIQPERELDQDAIDSYGVSTIDELLGEVQVELGDDEAPPLIIVNGHRINDLSEIGALPVEALRSVVVLPRGSAVRAGGSSNQRVVSITLRSSVRSATLTAAEKLATQGRWHAERGEAILTRIHGDTRFNVTLRGRGESRLFESDRGIIQTAPQRPYALGGNIIGYPNPTGEIDPLLSAAAGEIVTVTPFPSMSMPTIGDFVNRANQAAVTDLGAYRTLRPRNRNYDLNATFATRLSSWLTSTATLHLNQNTSDSERGLPAATFILSPTNPASPFSNRVGLAVYGPDPLLSRSRQTSGEGILTLDADFGQWNANLNARHSESKSVSRSQRAATFGSIALDDSVNPFAGGLGALIGIRSDEASTRTVNTLFDLTLNGPAATLPAGDVQATVEGRIAWNDLHSKSTYAVINQEADFHRAEQSFRGALDIPLTSRENRVLPQIGDLNATLEYSRVHFSDAGSLNHYSAALTWEPIRAVRLRGSFDQTDAPAPIQTLGDPVIVTQNVLVFDPLTSTSVSVTQIFGGNPFVLPQTTKVRNLSVLLRLLPRISLQANFDYFDTDRRNFLSSLPDSSAAVMLAFPERYVRDSNGVLTIIDLRPVNFDSDREKRLRWGLSMNTKIAGGQRSASGPAGRPAARGGVKSPSTYLQLTANHTIVFSDKIVIRPGLDPVDLLGGGAIGIGGNRPRHQIDATAAVTSGGLGARAGVTWRGKSELVTRIGTTTDTLQFSPILTLNMRLFAEGGRIIPQSKWAKGFRLSLDFLNLTNDRQKVRDSSGLTPLQYQPAYRDPLGRTIEIELRKVF